jgi:putative ABC transport system permease protein
MSLHVIGRRTHEIGVRKTLGASGLRVFTMLLRDSSRPALIANIVAWPLAFVAAQVYLSLFTTRVSLSLTPFAVGLGMTLLVAWVAVAFQAIRAASLKPGSVLRYE